MKDIDVLREMLTRAEVPFVERAKEDGEVEFKFDVDHKNVVGYSDFTCSMFFDVETGELTSLGVWEQ